MILLANALGEPLALSEGIVADAEAWTSEWGARAEEWYGEASAAGHELGPAWVNARLPLSVRRISEAERDEILDDGPPLLQREP